VCGGKHGMEVIMVCENKENDERRARDKEKE
jgi:hypothetical protein